MQRGKTKERRRGSIKSHEERAKCWHKKIKQKKTSKTLKSKPEKERNRERVNKNKREKKANNNNENNNMGLRKEQ